MNIFARHTYTQTNIKVYTFIYVYLSVRELLMLRI